VIPPPKNWVENGAPKSGFQKEVQSAANPSCPSGVLDVMLSAVSSPRAEGASTPLPRCYSDTAVTLSILQLNAESCSYKSYLAVTCRTCYSDLESVGALFQAFQRARIELFQAFQRARIELFQAGCDDLDGFLIFKYLVDQARH
jgi:hypothetical protein